jgi:hypothetical protein
MKKLFILVIGILIIAPGALNEISRGDIKKTGNMYVHSWEIKWSTPIKQYTPASC